MKRPTTFLARLLFNMATLADTVVERDVLEIERRFKHEGMSFLTITLPSLCDALDKGLALGRISTSDFLGFKPISRNGKLPALLQGFFMRVFELDGSLKDCPCIESIRSIRQACRAFKKVLLPCSPARIKSAFERYKSNDESVTWVDSDVLSLRTVAGYLWSDLELLAEQLYCKAGVFGSGATGERLGVKQRHSIMQWPERGENLFPAAAHCLSREDDQDTLSRIEFLDYSEELPVRVVSVPKTLKTPRIISVEPSYMMLRQQSIAKPLMMYLENHWFHKCIRFTDQTVNRDLARVGSIDGSLATIDLKDASDLVSNNLVKHIFSVCPTFLDFIQGCRSHRAKLPTGEVLNLKKFASQGSAMCFPVEAMVFATIVVASILKQRGVRPSLKEIRNITAKISVYGDDIIVPSQTAPLVMEHLESYGLRVNLDKSFYTGFFRESCGGDYYKGHDVTPVYVRQTKDEWSTKDSQYIVATVSLSNQFYMKGLWNVAQYIRDSIESKIGPLPRSRRDIGILAWTSILFDTVHKYRTDTHSWWVKGFGLCFRQVSDKVSDIRGAMLLEFGPRHLYESNRELGGFFVSRRKSDTFKFHSISREFSEDVIDDDRVSCIFIQPQGDFRNFEESSEWLSGYARLQDRRLSHLVTDGRGFDDTDLSIDPYASSIKRKWARSQSGLIW